MRKLLHLLLPTAAIVGLWLLSTASAQITVPNTLIPGTAIQSAPLNTNFTTLGNYALNRTGGTMTGALKVTSGSTALPGLSTAAAPSTGFVLGAGTISASLAGTQRWLLNSSGLTIFGANVIDATGRVLVPVIAVAITSAASPYTVTTATYVFVNATGGATTVTLPASPSLATAAVYVKKTDSSANAVTVGGNGNNIDGASTFVIAGQYDSFGFKYGGTEWGVF